MMSIQLFRDKSPHLPKAQYNWYFHCQCLQKPRNYNAWNMALLLCPGQIFLHIWVEIHEELCKEESSAYRILLSCTNILHIITKSQGKMEHQGTEQILLVNRKVLVMWFTLQIATSMRDFVFAAFERRACLMLQQHSQQLRDQKAFLSAQHSSDRSLCPFLKQRLQLTCTAAEC